MTQITGLCLSQYRLLIRRHAMTQEQCFLIKSENFLSSIPRDARCKYAFDKGGWLTDLLQTYNGATKPHRWGKISFGSFSHFDESLVVLQDFVSDHSYTHVKDGYILAKQYLERGHIEQYVDDRFITPDGQITHITGIDQFLSWLSNDHLEGVHLDVKTLLTDPSTSRFLTENPVCRADMTPDDDITRIIKEQCQDSFETVQECGERMGIYPPYGGSYIRHVN